MCVNLKYANRKEKVNGKVRQNLLESSTKDKYEIHKKTTNRKQCGRYKIWIPKV